MKEKYFKTGDIAKFGNVTSDTVRYYDKEQVVSPSMVKENKYRYYTFFDAIKFNGATLLREVDFPLQHLKEYLGLEHISAINEMNCRQIEQLKNKQKVLNRKIDFLEKYDAKLTEIKQNQNRIVLKKQLELYTCEAEIFHIDETGFQLQNQLKNDTVNDIFWNRTSVLGIVNQITDYGIREKYACCFSVIPGECFYIKRREFDTAIAYNVVGKIDKRELNRICQKIKIFAFDHHLTLADEFYQIYFYSQKQSDTEQYYIQLVFPCI